MPSYQRNFSTLLQPQKIKEVQVYLERRKTCQYVGTLCFDEQKNLFEFIYSAEYLRSRQIIPVGPELPLTRQIHQSKMLFPSFQDRIPVRENPAYPEYCEATGIDPNEQNPIILLATIGRRGPSSFVYIPHYEGIFTHKDLKKYREELDLTSREFASCFEISQAALTRIEKGQASGRDILKRIEIYKLFPEVALYEVYKSGGALHHQKRKKLLNILKQQIQERKTC